MGPDDVVLRTISVSFTEMRQYHALIDFLRDVEDYAKETEDADLLDLALGCKANLLIDYGEMA